MHIPLLLSRWPSRLNCASMLEPLLLRKDVLLIPRAASAEFVSFLVKSSKCRARQITLLTSGNSLSLSTTIESSLVWSSRLLAISLLVF
jgi:hypothetical protein